MQLSVFKKVTLPKTKEEKGLLAKYSSSPYLPELVECGDIRSLIKVVTTYGYSPSVFTDTRKQSNFKYTDFSILDIDEDLTIQEALSRVQEHDLLCICLTTSSHTPEHHKFRLIFPMSQRVSNKTDFVYNMELLRNIFPEADKQCVTDCGRFYFPSNLTDDGFVHEAELFQPKESPKAQNDTSKASNSNRVVRVDQNIESVVESIYGANKRTIPECVDLFIREAHTGLPGRWNNTVNAVCFTLALQGFTYDDVYSIIERLAPDNLDDRDEYTIERGYMQGVEAKESVSDSKKSW